MDDLVCIRFIHHILVGLDWGVPGPPGPPLATPLERLLVNNASIELLHDVHWNVQNAAEKHKPETRVSAALKPGFRVWQNERVSRVPGFSKPGFQSLFTPCPLRYKIGTELLHYQFCATHAYAVSYYYRTGHVTVMRSVLFTLGDSCNRVVRGY